MWTQEHLPKKENDIISFLSGYVCSTLARRISMSILISAKVDISDDDSMLIDARHRGGLWKVRPEITTIFSVAEIFIKSSTSTSGVVRSIQRKGLKSLWSILRF